MNNSIKISIVTVCFNAVNDIEQTILSVINQTYSNIEYIIIDGGSSDGTLDIINKYSDKLSYWISEPDKGIYDAMNKAIRHASGVYINFMNAGDKFVHNNIIKEVFSFFNDDLPTVIYGDTIEDYGMKTKVRRSLQPHYLKRRGILCHQSAFIRLDYHRDHLYDKKYKILADFNFFYHAYNYDNQVFKKVDKIISVFSMSDGGLSKNNYDRNYDELISILSPNLNRIKLLGLNIRRRLGKIKRSFSH